jgi:hypothetical protein
LFGHEARGRRTSGDQNDKNKGAEYSHDVDASKIHEEHDRIVAATVRGQRTKEI